MGQENSDTVSNTAGNANYNLGTSDLIWAREYEVPLKSRLPACTDSLQLQLSATRDSGLDLVLQTAQLTTHIGLVDITALALK